MAVSTSATSMPPWPTPQPLDPATIDAAVRNFRAAGLQPGDEVPEQPAPTQPEDPNAPGRGDGLIPAPPGSGDIQVGPARFHLYGMALGTAGLAGYGIFHHLMKARGISGGTMASIIAPAAVAGLVGARLYHVATDWEDYQHHPENIPKVWEGGLGIYGGVAAGALVGAAMARRAGIHVSPLLDAAAIALPVAQALGRSGNYFNQELFGKPTDAPWGLQVDPAYRPEGLEDRNSFHPTFLYEAGWNLALAGGLYGVSKVWKGRPPGALFALYLGGYGLGRFMVEGLRVDDSKQFAGLRTNQWTSLGIVGASAGALALMIARRGH